MNILGKGRVFWFYGLSASGKTTLADAFAKKLQKDEHQVLRLDGDITRKFLTKDLGYSLDDRFENIRRVAWVAKIVSEFGIYVVCSFITPLESMRLFLREFLGKRLVLINLRCRLETCVGRDPKGLYKKALNGEIKNFTGITQVYEPNPHGLDHVITTEGKYPHESYEELLEEFGMKDG